jgi:cyclic pyranopterin phosphate synthase
MTEFSHFDESGAPRMVDVGAKAVTQRTARATGCVRMAAKTLAQILGGGGAKGDVLGTARIAGIMAAKRTSEMIPLCHPLPLDCVTLSLAPLGPDCLGIECTVSTSAKTGVEMEALSAVSVAALTVYDMCKSHDRGMTIESIELAEKSGGASGDFRRGDSSKTDCSPPSEAARKSP